MLDPAQNWWLIVNYCNALTKMAVPRHQFDLKEWRRRNKVALFSRKNSPPKRGTY
jgi:hypothetical protein